MTDSTKPSFEYNELIKYAVQVYIVSQGLSYLDMNRLSFSRDKHNIQQKINQHLYDALRLMKFKDDP